MFCLNSQFIFAHTAIIAADIMPAPRDTEEDSLTAAESFEYNDDEDTEPTHRTSTSRRPDAFPDRSTSMPSRSPYHLPTGEMLRGVANRIIFSRYYILFYFVMMSLSLTTVIMSLIATRESRVEFGRSEPRRRSAITDSPPRTFYQSERAHADKTQIAKSVHRWFGTSSRSWSTDLW